MLQTKTAGFSKGPNCPTSYQLFAYELGVCVEEQRVMVSEHAANCDFCSAELDLYRHYPSLMDERIDEEKIPVHLYQLAEALLNNRTSGSLALQTLLESGPTNDKDLS